MGIWDALGFMEIAARRDAAPIINAHVAPGTEVWSDHTTMLDHFQMLVITGL